MMPRERRAAQWILELRVADALLAGAAQQDVARHLFGGAVASVRRRLESEACCVRIQRLVRRARTSLVAPLEGPWFD